LNSGTKSSNLYCEYRAEHRLSPEECDATCNVAHYVKTVEESKRLNELTEPALIISASGMATGGRVLHHLKAYAPDPKNTILIAGYQAAGTRGQAIAGGAKEIKIYGEYVPVRAEVAIIGALSWPARPFTPSPSVNRSASVTRSSEIPCATSQVNRPVSGSKLKSSLMMNEALVWVSR